MAPVPAASYTPEVVAAIDREKASERVEFFTLKKFVFDPNFISWVKLLYATPSASVNTNGIHSPFFSLQRGTLQGCLLSPLLFNIAIWLRDQEKFEGITHFGLVHKLSLYADDLVVPLQPCFLSCQYCQFWINLDICQGIN